MTKHAYMQQGYIWSVSGNSGVTSDYVYLALVMTWLVQELNRAYPCMQSHYPLLLLVGASLSVASLCSKASISQRDGFSGGKELRSG